MRNFFKHFGIIAIAAVTGLTMAGCYEDTYEPPDYDSFYQEPSTPSTPTEKQFPERTGFQVYSNANLKVQLRWDEDLFREVEYYTLQYRSETADSWTTVKSSAGLDRLDSTYYPDRYTVEFSRSDIGKYYTFRLRAIARSDIGYYPRNSDWVQVSATIRN